jgi:hypothetical protein
MQNSEQRIDVALQLSKGRHLFVIYCAHKYRP